MTVAAPASPLLDAARAWYDAGFCVIPSHEDGGKRPFGQWKKYQHERPTWEQLSIWLTSGRYTGIGLIMGKVSGNAEMLEIEGPSDLIAGRVNQLFETARALDIQGDLGLVELVERVYQGCSEVSAGGGLHMFLRITDGPVPGNTKIAMDGDKVVTETRGEGGFVIVWPTPARTGHKPNEAYLLLPNAHPSRAAEVTAAEHQWLHAIFSDAFGGLPEQPASPPAKKPSAPVTTGDLSPFDDYRQRVTWRDILEPAGWTWHSKDADHDYWVRPGKNPRDGHSASTIEDGPLYLFSTSVAGLPVGEGLSKGQVYAHLHHNGDLSAATRQLRNDGYGDPTPPTPTPLAEFILPNPQTDYDPANTYSDLTWVLTGERRQPPPPTWLTTVKGDRLFYTGRVNGLFGDPETAKSWIAMCAITEALHENERCAYLDVDHNGADEIASRLLALGAPAAAIANPDIFRVYEPEDRATLLTFVIDMHQWNPAITVVDSLGEIIPMLGLNSSDNDDLTHAIRAVLKPLAHRVGSCVITIDHLPKSTEARQSGYAIGGIAKKRAVDGAYYSCDTITPAAPDQIGKVRLTVEKDRHGPVRPAAVGQIAGDFILDSTGPGSTWKISTPEAGADGREKPTGAMEQISRYLEQQPYQRSESKNAIITALTEQGPFKKNTLTRALETLADDGLIHVAPKQRRTDKQEVTLVQHYRELDSA